MHDCYFQVAFAICFYTDTEDVRDRCHDTDHADEDVEVPWINIQFFTNILDIYGETKGQIA